MAKAARRSRTRGRPVRRSRGIPASKSRSRSTSRSRGRSNKKKRRSKKVGGGNNISNGSSEVATVGNKSNLSQSYEVDNAIVAEKENDIKQLILAIANEGRIDEDIINSLNTKLKKFGGVFQIQNTEDFKNKIRLAITILQGNSLNTTDLETNLENLIPKIIEVN